MISNAGKTGIRLIQELNMDNVYDKVDKTKDMDEQFNEFTHRAETLAKHINENISTLFNNIETF